jgi:hypothetical protein
MYLPGLKSTSDPTADRHIGFADYITRLWLSRSDGDSVSSLAEATKLSSWYSEMETTREPMHSYCCRSHQCGLRCLAPHCFLMHRVLTRQYRIEIMKQGAQEGEEIVLVCDMQAEVEASADIRVTPNRRRSLQPNTCPPLYKPRSRPSGFSLASSFRPSGKLLSLLPNVHEARARLQ